MDSGYNLKAENPKSGAFCGSKLFFLWMIKFIYKAVRHGLKVLDIFVVQPDDKSELLTNNLEKQWHAECQRAKRKNIKPSLLRALNKVFLKSYLFYGIFLFFEMIVIRCVQPLVMGYFLELFAQELSSFDILYITGLLLVLCSFFQLIIQHHCDFGQSLVGMRIRIAVSSLIYRKLLKLSQKSLEKTTTGQTVNLLSNDVGRFDQVMLFLHWIWIIPLQTIIVTYLFWTQTGVSSFVGVASMILLTIPVQGYIGKISAKLRMKIAYKTDYRVKLMSEIISGIQVIKMYAWEKPFEKTVHLTRLDEIKYLSRVSYLRGVFTSSIVFTERVVTFITTVTYVLMGNQLTASVVYPVAQFINILQLSLAIIYPIILQWAGESLVAIKRLEEFLNMEERVETIIEEVPGIGVVLKNLNASWTNNETLKNINLDIEPGSLCAIVGPVGAGKSSILQILLGELAPMSGIVKVGGSISYSSQEPWLFVSSVRNNVIFGQEYDKTHYREVVKVCALEKDFQQFPDGDRTLIGEKGVSLSGGQRARINLARAVYRDADIYLLDDPLSAVDTRVGKHLFEECIVKYLRGKTRILVTHQLQYLKKADLIVIVNEGCIEAQGTFDELSKSDLDFTKLLVANDETGEEIEAKKADRRESTLATISSKLVESILGEPEQFEEEEMGSKDASPFLDYFKAGGSICVRLGLIFILFLSQASCTISDLWLSFWVSQEETKSFDANIVLLNNTVNKDLIYDTFMDDYLIDDKIYHLIKRDYAMIIYAVAIGLVVLLTLARSMLFFKIVMTASKNLHNAMFSSLIRAPMRFFNTTPAGRMLNRFSKDMGAIDEFLPRALIEAIQIILVMTGILVIVIVANYYMLIVIAILGAVFLILKEWYTKSARDIKHIEGITKSPVFSYISSSLEGLVTIRASHSENILMQEFDHHQDVHTSAWFLTVACRSAFGLWFDILSFIFISIIVFGFAIIYNFGTISGAVAGVAIQQSLILTGMLQYGIQQITNAVNQLTSVERVLQYTKLENEEPFSKLVKPSKSPWPDMGKIEFKKLYLRYSENDPPVIKNLNIVVESGDKIGIVGRTGAGKSSIISALFRLALIEGQIIIDGVDTQSISLKELRKNISIIPQEPVLFSATLRYNLDPFDEFDDDKIWAALEEVELKTIASSLDYQVSGGGSNFSLGQRQLICLARAILRNNKILVLDEATANVDQQTDSLIQTTIRNKFANCTVLTIAHRLNTIMDSDKVLVMDTGKMVEYDHPYVLLQDPNGYLSKMVAETGPSMSQQLRNMSQRFYLDTISD